MAILLETCRVSSQHHITYSGKVKGSSVQYILTQLTTIYISASCNILLSSYILFFSWPASGNYRKALGKWLQSPQYRISGVVISPSFQRRTLPSRLRTKSTPLQLLYLTARSPKVSHNPRSNSIRCWDYAQRSPIIITQRPLPLYQGGNRLLLLNVFNSEIQQTSHTCGFYIHFPPGGLG